MILVMRLLYFSFWLLGISMVFIENIDIDLGFLVAIICIIGAFWLSIEISRKEKELNIEPEYRMFNFYE